MADSEDAQPPLKPYELLYSFQLALMYDLRHGWKEWREWYDVKENRFTETVVHRRHNPLYWFGIIGSINLVFTGVVVVVAWSLFGRGFSHSWWIIGLLAGSVLLSLLGSLISRRVTMTEKRRREESYYPPKEYWEGVDEAGNAEAN